MVAVKFLYHLPVTVKLSLRPRPIVAVELNKELTCGRDPIVATGLTCDPIVAVELTLTLLGRIVGVR